jgi:RNA polymerase subunit RPABC4/transcription elongation factor Spt4
MVCSRCGYMTGPFDKSCPRCSHPDYVAPVIAPTQSEQAVNLISCPACQQMVSTQAVACPKCGQPIFKTANQSIHPSQMPPNVLAGNGSGTGPTAILPDQLKGFNWGACLLGWIWAIGNNTWIGLLCLIPYVGLIMFIILAIKGNEWAWQNRRWESVEQFKQVQAIWTKSGIITFFVFTAISVVYAVVSFVIFSHQ